MATSTNKPRSSYFSPAELQILMTAYAESEHIFLLKSNTMAAAKKRELAWKKIADRVRVFEKKKMFSLECSTYSTIIFHMCVCAHSCNTTGPKRTWLQLKMKYKNVVQTDKV